MEEKGYYNGSAYMGLIGNHYKEFSDETEYLETIRELKNEED